MQKILTIFCCSVIVAFATSPTTVELHSQWNEFKLVHNKTYENAAEELKRLQIFFVKLMQIEGHNKLYEQGLVSYKKGVNRFSDWTHDEFKRYLTKSKRPQYKSVGTFSKSLRTDLPSEIDLRQYGWVTRVKNQGDCQSCWAFSTTGALEGQHAKKSGELISLSEQELVDCSKKPNEGCNGGYLDAALDYVEKNGLTSERVYQYEHIDGECRRHGKPEIVRSHGYLEIASENETDLQAAVATVGPVSATIDGTSIQDYSMGVYGGSCASEIDFLNHAVLVVGYGKDNGQDYWIVKNSWGSSWGEDGYIRLLRNENVCGIATAALFPLV